MNSRQLLLASWVISSSSFADVRLPAVFSDHMVLQSGVSAPVWGWASPGEKIKVEIAGKTAEATAGADGKWRANLPELKAGGPHKLVVAGMSRIVIDDVLVGEVWLGSGQSNMGMKVNAANDFEKEKVAADLPLIRVFDTGMQNTPEPADDCKGEWKVCAPDTFGTFSATAFFFGREIHRELKLPVGLIVSAVGGTPIDSWVDRSLQESAPEMKGFFAAQSGDAASADPAKEKAAFDAEMKKWQQDAKKARDEGKPLPRRPRNPGEVRARKSNLGGLFNGMIMPLVPYAIRGALWYQGEANTVPAKAPYYQHQLAMLVNDWRRSWGTDFPVAWVQLPNFAGIGRDIPQVREAMLKTLRLPKTGMAVAIDVGETNNIHPKNKQEVGRRLAQWALATVYEKSGVESSGPLPAKHELRGGEIVVSFTHARGLIAKGGEPAAFQIAGEDRKWQPATAKIVGETAVVSSPAVTKPVAVRYAWENDPKCSLYNEAGMPASPFRTDDWKLDPPAAPEPRPRALRGRAKAK